MRDGVLGHGAGARYAWGMPKLPSQAHIDIYLASAAGIAVALHRLAIGMEMDGAFVFATIAIIASLCAAGFLGAHLLRR